MSSVEKMIEENSNIFQQIVLLGGQLERAKDRLNLFNWIRALINLANDPNDSNYHEHLKIKYEYLQYLYATLKGPYKKLANPFNTSKVPLKADEWIPFCECISNKIADLYQDLIPRAGPLRPLMCHKSDDNRAFLCVKRTPDNGILCYMCCAPDANAMSMPKK